MKMSNFAKYDQSNLNRDLFGLTLDPNGTTTLQTQLIEALRGIITSTPGHAGTRLPASRALATELSVSRTTVQVAYDQLISEGYLVSRRGSGTFVAENVSHLTSPLQRQPTQRPRVSQWRPFQTGIPDPSLLPHAQWAQHLERAWTKPEPDLLGRADPCGWYPLRAAISDHLAAWRHLTCDPEQVLITSGARESLEIIFSGLFAPSQTVAIEDPCWPRTREVLEATGAVPHSVPIDADGLNPEGFPDRSAAVIVTPSRHYPTGRSLPLPRRVTLLDWAKRTGGLIIEDDYDSEFRYQGHPLPSFAGLDGLQNTIYLGSFSKLISPALRIGYLVLPRHHLPQARVFLERTGPCASLIPQPALATFMSSGDYAIHLRRIRRIYAQRQAHLLSCLLPLPDLLEINPDPAGMHLCLPLKPKLSDRVSDRHISQQARDAGLSVAALSSHSTQPDPPQALLLGYAAFDEDRLTAASETLIKILRDIA